MNDETAESHRLDKWLWAARFFKTRTIAAAAVAGGRVHLNGSRAKPGKPVKIGDEVHIRQGPYEWTIVVRGLDKQRGPASQAQLLYEETRENREGREKMAAELRLLGPTPPQTKGRPTKRARRDLMRFRGGGGT